MKTVTRYNNAGCTKIYGGTMAWMLFAFVFFPFEAARFHFDLSRAGFAFWRSFWVWGWLWRKNGVVWRSL